ncbi:hypothetical protein [Streptomyces scopuliridis]|uniref:hypothetical protein n=1 Tax=Streptomyces scopuliridis TaxID=452529 RepID=UPI00368CF7F6
MLGKDLGVQVEDLRLVAGVMRLVVAVLSVVVGGVRVRFGHSVTLSRSCACGTVAFR